MTPAPPAPDLPRLRRDRHAKLTQALALTDAAAMVLIGTTNVRWATGARVVAAEPGRSARFRNVAVAVAGDPVPHLFTHYPEGVPEDLPADHLHFGLDLDTERGASDLIDFVADAVPPGDRVLVDEWTMPLRGLWEERLPTHAAGDAMAAVMRPCRLLKTVDELACIRMAQWMNEQAMTSVQPAARTGTRQCDLSGLFLRRAFELGAHQNTVDPIWQVMPDSVAAGPRSVTGGLVFPTVTTVRTLGRGDVIWVDTGITWHGYDSDFGRTWIVDADPEPAQQDQFRRWRAVVDAVLDVTRAGATGADLTRAAVTAAGGERPWLPHLYLADGIGVDSAEPPFVGTDLGPAADDSIVLSPGTVFVLEPVVWRVGTGGYRSEEIVAVTDDGYQLLSDHTYEPYG